MLPSVGALKGAATLGRRLQLPAWVGPVALLGGIVWLLLDLDRRRLVGRVLWHLAKEAMRLEGLQRQALASLETVLFEPADPPSDKRMVATVLGRASEPLLAC